MSYMERIAIVEDELKLRAILKEGLETEGYDVDAFATAESAEEKILQKSASYSLIILDLMLPGKKGSDLCRDLRAKGIATPILILTARGAIVDKVEVLDAGADDFVTKPFSFEELLARIRALLRRPQALKQERLLYGLLALDAGTREVRKGNKALILTATEFDLFYLLIEHKGQVVSRDSISNHLWELDSADLGNVVDVHISNLRKKLDDYDQKIIRTVRGIGYLVQE
jgi:DNA-binding response OmpR family regulator